MADSQELAILLKAQNLTKQAFDEARKELADIRNKVGDTDSDTRGFSATLRDFAKEHKESFQAVGTVVGVVAGALVGLGAGIAALGVRGATVSDVRAHFDELTKSIGGSADAMLGALKRATGGTITDFDLMKSTNIGLSQGLKLTTADLDLTGKAARALADRLGGDTKDAYDALIQVMATGQDKQLKGIGVNIDAENAVLRYAKSLGREAETLSESEKQQAIKMATLEQLKRVVAESGEAEDDFADKLDKAKAGFQNILDRMGEAIAASPVVNAALDAVGSALENAFGAANQKNIKTLTGYIGDGAFILLRFAEAGITTADLVNRAWNGLSLVFSATFSVLSEGVLLLATMATKAYELAAALPGAGVQFQILGAEARQIRDFMQGVQQSFHEQAEEALEGVKGNSAFHGVLEQVREGLEAARGSMERASRTEAEATETTKAHTVALKALGSENLKAAAAATKKAAADALAQSKADLDDWADTIRRHNEEQRAGEQETMDALEKIDKERFDQARIDLDEWAEVVRRHQEEQRAGEELTLAAINKQSKESKAALSNLSEALAQLAQVSGGTFGGMVSSLAQVVTAANAAQKAIDLMRHAGDKDANGKGKGLEGLLEMSSGIMGIVSAALAAGKAVAALFGLFDRNKGRDLVVDFAETFGGFDELHKKLAELGEEGEQLWIKLTQGVGRNNPTQAQQAIDEITAALEKQKKKQGDVQGQTEESAQATIETATQAALALDDLGVRLQANEEAWAEWSRLVTGGISAVASAVRGIPLPSPSVAPPAGQEGFAGGTHGKYIDFGAGRSVTLHHRERVMTEAEGRASQQPIIVQSIVHVDGREIARTAAQYQRSVLAPYGVR